MYVSHVNEAGNVIAFRRYDGLGNSLMVIANFSNNDFASYRIGVPVAGNWLESIDSQSAKYDGDGLDNPGVLATEATSADGYAQSLVVRVPKMGLLVLGPQSLLDVADAPAPTRLRFSRVAPVPARAGASIVFTLPRAGHARLALVDVTGRAVATLLDGPLGAGEHTVRWDGRDARGQRVGAGVYFLALESDGARAVQRIPVLALAAARIRPDAPARTRRGVLVQLGPGGRHSVGPASPSPRPRDGGDRHGGPIAGRDDALVASG